MDRNLNHLNKLANIKSNNDIPLLNSSVSPGSHCPMHTALAFLRRLKGISTLVVGMPECSYYSRFIIHDSYGSPGELHYTYVLDSNETVFGCRKGLMDALYEMDKEGAGVIFIVMTCIPELIGEDIEAVIYEMQDTLEAEILPVIVPHFKYNGYQSGAMNTINSLIRLMKPAKIKQKQVNLLGDAGGADFGLLLNELKKKDYNVKKLGAGMSVDEIKEAPESVLNIVLSPHGLNLARNMKESFEIPYVSMHNIYSAVDIDLGYEQVFCYLGITSGFKFNIYGEEIEQLETEIKNKFKGNKYIVTDTNTDPIPLAVYLAGLGLEPELLHIEEFYGEDIVYTAELIKKGYNPYVCYVTEPAELNQVMAVLESALSLGKCGSLAGDYGIMDSDVRQINAKIGYDRTRSLLQLVNSCLEQAAGRKR